MILVNKKWKLLPKIFNFYQIHAVRINVVNFDVDVDFDFPFFVEVDE